jgi:membrane-bound ClpP family serine protease
LNPNTAFALTALGLLGIYTEFCAPGLILPGVLGTTLSLLGASAILTHPIDPRGATLIAAAFLACTLDAKLNTRGRLTALAALALFAGALLLIPAPGIHPAPRIHPAIAAAVAISLAPLTSFLLSAAFRARRNKQTDILI